MNVTVSRSSPSAAIVDLHGFVVAHNNVPIQANQFEAMEEEKPDFGQSNTTVCC